MPSSQPSREPGDLVVTPRLLFHRFQDSLNALAIEDDQAAAIARHRTPSAPLSPDGRVAGKKNRSLRIAEGAQPLRRVVVEGNGIRPRRAIPQNELVVLPCRGSAPAKNRTWARGLGNRCSIH